MRHFLAAVVTVALIVGSAGMADAKQCRDKTGKFIKCPTPAPAPATLRCKNSKTGKFAKCGTPGAVPIH